MITVSNLPALLGPFLDPAAMGIVVGGTLLAVALRSAFDDLIRGIGATGVLYRRAFAAEPLLQQIAALGRIARRHGVVALDRSVITDPDVAAAVTAIVDGADAGEVATLVEHCRRARIERHVAAADVWVAAAEVAPAMGMIGTLIGLVKMFLAVNDPTAIGRAMAVALLATLYGAIVSNLIAMPIASRLRRKAREEAFQRARLEVPLVALAAREAPRRGDQIAA